MAGDFARDGIQMRRQRFHLPAQALPARAPRAVEPKAGAIAYFRYKLPINSTQLVEKLLHEKSVLIVPGDHFGMDHYLRIGYGPPADYLTAALNRVEEGLKEVS